MVLLWNRTLSDNDINTYKDQDADDVFDVNPSAKLSTTWGYLKQVP